MKFEWPESVAVLKGDDFIRNRLVGRECSVPKKKGEKPVCKCCMLGHFYQQLIGPIPLNTDGDAAINEDAVLKALPKKVMQVFARETVAVLGRPYNCDGELEEVSKNTIDAVEVNDGFRGWEKIGSRAAMPQKTGKAVHVPLEKLAEIFNRVTRRLGYVPKGPRARRAYMQVKEVAA